MSITPDQASRTEATRVCPYCAESVRPAAKLCPHCRQWLTLRSLRHPAILLWLAGGPTVATLLAVGLVLISRVERLVNPQPPYIKPLGLLRIVNTGMAWRQTTSDRRIQLTGYITNQSDIPWHGIELECRFFDTNGALIDVAHPHCYQTIQPHDDAGFSLLVSASRPTNSYASYTLTVTTARSASGLY